MKAWRDSSTLILAARHVRKSNRDSPPRTVAQYDYNLLCLKRHQKSSFMPGSYVFPGGAVSSADTDLKWSNLFATYGFDKQSLTSLIPNTKDRPQIFHRKNDDELPKEISLRITAIRETFEECGILLCKQSPQTESLTYWAQHLKDELSGWQSKVQNDAREFYTLCKTLKCYPDIWSLQEWSNWLTPTALTSKRFDAIFYLACMQSMSSTDIQDKEMEGFKWATPREFLDSTPNIILPSPQHYEISSISKFQDLDDLLNFAMGRNKLGVQQYMPVIACLADGRVHVLPGDSMYPSNVSLTEKQEIIQKDTSITQFREQSHMKHRIEYFDLEPKKVEIHKLET